MRTNQDLADLQPAEMKILKMFTTQSMQIIIRPLQWSDDDLHLLT